MLTGLTAVLSDDFHTRFCQVASALRASGKTVNLMLQKKDVRAEILCDNSSFLLLHRNPDKRACPSLPGEELFFLRRPSGGFAMRIRRPGRVGRR